MNLNKLCFYKFVKFIFAVGNSINLCSKSERKILNIKQRVIMGRKKESKLGILLKIIIVI